MTQTAQQLQPKADTFAHIALVRIGKMSIEQHLESINDRLQAIESDNRDSAKVRSEMMSKISTLDERLNRYASVDWVRDAITPMQEGMASLRESLGLLSKDVGALTKEVNVVFQMQETLIQERTENERREHAERLKAEEEKREQQRLLYEQQLSGAKEVQQKQVEAFAATTAAEKRKQIRHRIREHAPWIVTLLLGLFTLGGYIKSALMFAWESLKNGLRT